MGIVGHHIIEHRLAREVCVGREVDQRAIEADRTVAGITYADKPDRVTVNVVIVSQQQRRIDRQRGIFHRLDKVGPRHRRVVDRCHLQHHGTVRWSFAVIGNGIDQPILARIIAQRGIERKGAVIAVEGAHHMHVFARSTAQGAGNQHIDLGFEVERHIARKRPGGGIDAEPGRQSSAPVKRCAPHCTANLRQRCRDAQMRQLDRHASVRRLAQRRDPQRIAFRIKIVAQQIGDRKASALAFTCGDQIGRRLGPLARGPHFEEDQCRPDRNAALFVHRIVADHHRAVEIGAGVEIDLIGRSAGRRAGCGNQPEGIIHHCFGDDRHRRPAAARGHIDPHWHCAHPFGRRGAGEAQAGGIKVQPAIQRRTAFTLGSDRSGAAEVEREQPLAREPRIARQGLVDRPNLGSQIGLRIDPEFEREAPVAGGIGTIGQHPRPGGEDHLYHRHLRVVARRECRKAEAARGGIEVEVIGQRPDIRTQIIWQGLVALESGRDRATLEIEQSDIAVIGLARRQPGGIEQHRIAEHLDRHAAAGDHAGEQQRHFEGHGSCGRRAGELQCCRVKAQPGRKRAGAIVLGGDIGIGPQRTRAEFERLGEGWANLIAVQHITAQADPGC